jgi:hypothetical protein
MWGVALDQQTAQQPLSLEALDQSEPEPHVAALMAATAEVVSGGGRAFASASNNHLVERAPDARHEPIPAPGNGHNVVVPAAALA